ncbi:S1C family serine protease [Curvibacter sp. PAE-UM]|uniref:S1C family serine protease n=1 Tax=Curvibacter sp. PAE-UM TaxID=1714344 RepID=UPI0007126F02|nr:serine protease [Curvibacter sp. PAE-UM]KRI00511.1 hypothetical protein AO057_11570 [Curvibacter sp. PAE-UM]
MRLGKSIVLIFILNFPHHFLQPGAVRDFTMFPFALLFRRPVGAALVLCALAASLGAGVVRAQAVDAGGAAEASEQGPVVWAEPSASVRELFSRNKERLLQVRVLLSSANEQSSLGSGFLVRDDGVRGAWVITNYHVVSALAIDPKKYRLELRGTNERTVRAQLLAVDVIHDLAVLRIDHTPQAAPWKVFPLREQALSQGSKVFSLGNPLELGFLISEGIYNGLVESRIYDQMLFSGSINSGMSGGPAIDEGGRVVGVNVATRRDGQSLSFLVPVKYVRALMQEAVKGQIRTEWRSEIARQLRVHQDFVASKILTMAEAGDGAQTPAPRAGFASQSLDGRKVPTLDGSLTKCWARGTENEKLRFQRDSLDCSLHSGLFVSRQLYTGSLSLQHVLFRNEKLATVQFLKMGSSGSVSGSGRATSEITRSECHGDYVQGASHVYRVSVCVRAYRKFEDLYDLTLNAVQVDDARERLASSLNLRGFSFENAQRLSARFLELLQ